MNATATPQRVITVRMPHDIHRALRDEAWKRKTSLNKLCLAKLLQPVTHVPGEDSEPDPPSGTTS